MNPVKWIATIIALLLLWQVKGLQPIIKILGVLVALGLLLRYFTNIDSEFKAVLNSKPAAKKTTTTTDTPTTSNQDAPTVPDDAMRKVKGDDLTTTAINKPDTRNMAAGAAILF